MKIWLSLFLQCILVISLQAQCLEGNCSTGNGTFVFDNGSKYSGDFVDGKFQGKGRMDYENGNIYAGSWFKHTRNGEGTLHFANGDKYKGNFKKNQFSGQGIYYYKDGSRYEGNWIEHKANGKGTYYFTDGERYEGDFVNGAFEGKGAFYYQDGSVFFGDWSGNKKNGGGMLHMENGDKVKGTWKNDELVDRNLPQKRPMQQEKRQMNTSEQAVESTTKTETPNGSASSETSFVQSKYYKNCNQLYCHQEQGRYTYKDGSKWEGMMYDGKPKGEGLLYYSNGNIYQGAFDKHAPNGEGIMYFSSGLSITGDWKEGYPVKKYSQGKKRFQESKKQIESQHSSDITIWAVIVGVASYAHMPSLKYTDDDAYQVYAFLKSPQGGALPDKQIKLLIDEAATRENILASMNEVLLRADENDVVMMYYSGHGLPGSFLPSDFDGYNNSLSHKEVINIFNTSKAKHKICIADACHSGSLLASRTPFRGTDMESYYNAFEITGGGTAMFMSSKSEELSLEASGLRQGIFSHYLIRGLKGEADTNHNKIVTVDELYSFVNKGVRSYSNNMQSPTIAGNYDKNMPVGMVY